MDQKGIWTPTVIAGGSGIVIDSGQWFKCFNLVYISIATWRFSIENATSDVFILSIPFPAVSVRSIGVAGYNSSGKNLFPLISVNGGLSFCIKNPDGGTIDLKGTEIPDCILQFSVMYFTA